MKALPLQPNLVEQVTNALIEEIATGQLRPGQRIIQERIAEALGVSRQPVQQALLLLRNQGLLRDAPGRGQIVAPLDADHVSHMYQMRAVIEGLAARLAAEACTEQAARQGAAIIEAGNKALAAGAAGKLVTIDLRFHQFVHTLSGNPLIAAAMAPHLIYTRRVMGEVIHRYVTPREVWDEHAAIFDAIAGGDGDRAEALTRAHIAQAARFVVADMQASRQDRLGATGT